MSCPTEAPTAAGGAYRHRHLVADLFALLDHLDLQRSYLFGSSFGSTIALATLAHDAGAAAAGGASRRVRIRPLAGWERFLCSFARYWRGPMRTLPLRGRLDYPADVRSFAQCAGALDVFEGQHRGRFEGGGRPPGTDGPADRSAAAAARIRQPVLLVCGDGDPIVPRVCDGPLLEGCRTSERVEFPKCGHYPSTRTRRCWRKSCGGF